MEIWRRVRGVGFGAAILVLAGCSEPVEPAFPGIEVTLSLSQEEISVGETIEIRVRATNITEGELSFSTGPCPLLVRFLDQSNRPLFTLPSTCNSINHHYALGPGESVERVVVSGSLPLEPGTYMVFAVISSDLLNPSDTLELRIDP